MSLQPPPGKSQIGQVWVDPITGHRFVFTGENLGEINYGWEPWDLVNEWVEYERDDDPNRDTRP